MKPRHVVILIIFVFVNIAVVMSLNFSVAFFSDKEVEEEVEEIPFIQTLSAQKIINQEETFKVSSYGTVSAFNAIDISSEVQGKLSKGKHHLKPGVTFRKGDLLFKISDTDAQYNLRARKSSFINILANLLPDLKTDYPSEFAKWENYTARIKLNENLPPLPSWKTSKEKIFLSTRNVLTEYFSIKSMEEQLRKYSVYAPFNGMISDLYSSNLAIVNPGTRVLRIVETSNFEIEASIPANEIDRVKIGTTVSIHTTTGELKGIGNVVRMSDMINKNTQAIAIYIKPEAVENEKFIEGEYVEVKINGQATYNGTRIPKDALFNNQVYLFDKQTKKLKIKAVQTLNTNEAGVFVKGLNDNSVVISQEVLNYTDTTTYSVLIK